ncbi:phage baseplate assembly protein V [Pseudomonas sp.]|uniref:phage baseplate assembly protein V n=1 Tax=Pseudomonas sp. TaxID=306 RepID=UPI00258849B7|nr:phage baseplate assembly protein V [Pseudomonas sp.]
MDDPLEWVAIALGAAQSKLWTSLPGIIQSFDPDAMTVTVQPAVRALVRGEAGAQVATDLPLLLDCPAQFPAGGGCTLTFPVQAGDECLVVFASRCIDAWWQSGGIQNQAELRMHDLSDGFALLGFRSQPRVISGVSTTAAQLRSDDGEAFVELNPTSHAVTATTPGAITLNAATVTINAPQIVLNGQVTQGKGSNGGAMELQGPVNVATDVIASGKHLATHTHPGDSGGTTGAPNS